MRKTFEFKPGDPVWLMHDDHAVCGRIVKMSFNRIVSCVDFETVSDHEWYYVSVNDKNIGSFELKDLFKTKEELLKSL